MAQSLNIKIAGLYTAPNPFSAVPEGALSIASNVVIDEESIAKSRRGLGKYGNVFSAPLTSLFQFRGRLLPYFSDTTLARDSDGAGTWINYAGTIAPAQPDVKLRSVEALKNIYFNSSAGMVKLDSLTGVPYAAGGVRALGGLGSLSGATGYLPNASVVAYRIVWKFVDANENLILGAPSSRITVSNNAGATRNVSLTFRVPQIVTASFYYQIYRSNDSGSLSVEPDDEMQLVFESQPTAGQITASSVTVVDSTPNSLKGATLYTSPSQEGIALSNESPPFCKDMTVFKGSTFAANTRSKQRLTLTLIGVGGSSLSIDDTVTIAGVVYTGKAAEDAALNQFLISSTGDPADDIEVTAQSLARVINASASNTTVYAYYLSGFSELPGKFLIEERAIGGASFAANSNRGASFIPILPVSGAAISSTNDERLNGVSFSKPGINEAFPLPYFFNIGSADAPVRRILALRDSVFVLKDDGVFRIVGEDPASFRVSTFDTTTQILGAETAVVLNNTIMMFSDQTVVSVSESGVQVVSRPIEQDLLRISSALFPNFASASFAVGYESDRKYILFTVSRTSDTVATIAYVYNLFTQSWTTWDRSERAGIVLSQDNKLYFASGNNNYVYKERKDFALTDYVDDEIALTVTASSGTSLSVASTVGLEPSWLIEQVGAAASILSIDSPTDITLTSAQVFTPGAATAFEPIVQEVQFTPLSQGNPGLMKHFRETTFFFRDAQFDAITLGFSNNFVNSTLFTTVVPVASGLWGDFPWGSSPWGGGLGEQQGIRTFIPANRQRALWLSLSVRLSQPRNSFSLEGVSIVFEPMSTRFK